MLRLRIVSDHRTSLGGNAEKIDAAVGALSKRIQKSLAVGTETLTMALDKSATSVEEALHTTSRRTVKQIGALAATPALNGIKARLDPRAYNGASMVGLNGVVIKSHGGADRVSFANAVSVVTAPSAANAPSALSVAKSPRAPASRARPRRLSRSLFCGGVETSGRAPPYPRYKIRGRRCITRSFHPRLAACRTL